MPFHQIMINIIAAIGQNRELGASNDLLWHIPEDARHFKELTTGHPVIMGRKTFESIPAKFRPLPNRTNIVVTRNPDLDVSDDIIVVNSLAEAIKQAEQSTGSDEIFIMGGGQIYAEGLPLADRLYLTLVERTFPQADIFFPEYQNIFAKEISREEKSDEQFKYTFLTLEKIDG